MKNRITAALLAFFLGGIGGQFFYLGKAVKGMLCLLLSWTFIPALIGLYHTIRFLTMSDEAFHAEYNQGIAPPVMLAFAPGSPIGDEMNKLYELRKTGTITEQEFKTHEAQLLG